MYIGTVEDSLDLQGIRVFEKRVRHLHESGSGKPRKTSAKNQPCKSMHYIEVTCYTLKIRNPFRIYKAKRKRVLITDY